MLLATDLDMLKGLVKRNVCVITVVILQEDKLLTVIFSYTLKNSE